MWLFRSSCFHSSLSKTCAMCVILVENVNQVTSVKVKQQTISRNSQYVHPRNVRTIGTLKCSTLCILLLLFSWQGSFEIQNTAAWEDSFTNVSSAITLVALKRELTSRADSAILQISTKHTRCFRKKNIVFSLVSLVILLLPYFLTLLFLCCSPRKPFSASGENHFDSPCGSLEPRSQTSKKKNQLPLYRAK